MASPQIINIDASSDGTGAQPNVAAMVRNDTYFLEKLAERWIKETGNQRPGITYRLAQLPTGYAGFERQRDGSKHVDRYLYGHPNGVFRSLNEIYPHFKYLQDNHGTVGCPCKLCTGLGKSKSKSKRKSESNSIVSGSPSERSSHFGATSAGAALTGNAPIVAKPAVKAKSSSFKSAIRNDNPQGLPQGRLTSDSPAPKRNTVNEEGTPDIFRKLLDRLQEAGPKGLTEDIVDQLSPDWRAGNQQLQSLITEWQSRPAYVPRMGEIVLFTRDVSDGETIAWDASSQTLRRTDLDSRSWLNRVSWEAGVVTQLPLEPVAEDDLTGLTTEKKQNIAYAGFRIEPIPEPSNEFKPFSKQHKYVPLHAIRPFSFWKECIRGLSEQDWHPTVKHALTLSSSFSLIGKYSFKGVWPEATLFVRGVFLGPEFVMVGDVVRLAPMHPKRQVTDVMVVSSIRLRFVNLDQTSENDNDDGRPYLTCLHVCGRAFTLDPKKSNDGIAKAPVKPGEHGLPSWFKSYGQWFNALDAEDPKAKLEVPYHRVIGRCLEDSAVKSWYSTPNDLAPASSFQAVNSATAASKFRASDISQGLENVQDARKYSRTHDARIDRNAGKSWYWAETRIEQLDLHEVNGAFIGLKDEERSSKQMNTWRQALKVLDGKGGIEEYHAAQRQRQEEQRRRESAQVASGSWGLMGSAVKANIMDSASGENDDAMEENGPEGSAMQGDEMEDLGLEGDAADDDAMEVEDEHGFQTLQTRADVVDLSNEDDEMYD
ncbi:hypothetical protein PRZ48_005007 [Zasmidium cellare]|uniref:Uncharacterized protein n=1 Tax=Zasmidium cellare TaxID=395010 RepID=A0ABR0ER64_ZASCE|nr:hypothetical protein PRZ48_005007 [Zasmidium cellare]